jgi:hypothetical protein
MARSRASLLRSRRREAVVGLLDPAGYGPRPHGRGYKKDFFRVTPYHA